jgi:flagellar motor switch protein FliG
VNSFVFEDLRKLDDLEIQSVLRDVDAATLILALTSASEELMNRVLANMGNRAAMLIREEVASLGSPPPGDVAKAQQTILSIYRAFSGGG